ncbi:hypothetical protein [Chelatococcus sp. YT9]|uniref:beta strand repeat-containing protein n=1 Tax=Chelatococcus sp. YT9 TaxID=2835635 RepID=UPI001BCCD30F|nr:hypothetical protein [Chelatococcus sp. YT9]MBS7699039.1 hypothetical protein [Chelatococcus sp. YT9]
MTDIAVNDALDGAPMSGATNSTTLKEYAIEVKQWQLYEQLKLSIGSHVFSASSVVEGFRLNTPTGPQCNGQASLDHFVAFNKAAIESLTGGTVFVRPAQSGSGNFEIVIQAKDGADLNGGPVSAAMDRGKSLHAPAHGDGLAQDSLVSVTTKGMPAAIPEHSTEPVTTDGAHVSGTAQAIIDVADWDASDTLHINIGEHAFYGSGDANRSTSLSQFVDANGAAIEALTGGKLVVQDGDLAIMGAASLKGGAISAYLEKSGVGSDSPAVLHVEQATAAAGSAAFEPPATTPTSSEYRITIGPWMQHQQFQLTIGEHVYSSYGVFGIDTAGSLARFVELNKGPIEALTGGKVIADGNTLVIHGDAGLKGGDVSAHMDEWNGTSINVAKTPYEKPTSGTGTDGTDGTNTGDNGTDGTDGTNTSGTDGTNTHGNGTDGTDGTNTSGTDGTNTHGNGTDGTDGTNTSGTDGTNTNGNGTDGTNGTNTSGTDGTNTHGNGTDGTDGTNTSGTDGTNTNGNGTDGTDGTNTSGTDGTNTNGNGTDGTNGTNTSGTDGTNTHGNGTDGTDSGDGAKDGTVKGTSTDTGTNYTVDSGGFNQDGDAEKVIDGLNLGTQNIKGRVDTVDFAFDIDLVANTSRVQAITGATLKEAVDGLFHAGGELDGSHNTAGLFGYGGDVYLVAARDTGAAFGADDVIIKVTGYTGVIDHSDFV